jgi:hypothetical protein
MDGVGDRFDEVDGSGESGFAGNISGHVGCAAIDMVLDVVLDVVSFGGWVVFSSFQVFERLVESVDKEKGDDDRCEFPMHDVCGKGHLDCSDRFLEYGSGENPILPLSNNTLAITL